MSAAGARQRSRCRQRQVPGRCGPKNAKFDRRELFENMVKPRVLQELSDWLQGLGGVYRLISHAAGTPSYCCVSFDYTGLTEERGLSDLRSSRIFTDTASPVSAGLSSGAPWCPDFF